MPQKFRQSRNLYIRMHRRVLQLAEHGAIKMIRGPWCSFRVLWKDRPIDIPTRKAAHLLVVVEATNHSTGRRATGIFQYVDEVVALANRRTEKALRDAADEMYADSPDRLEEIAS